jgi:hypothetical protein
VLIPAAESIRVAFVNWPKLSRMVFLSGQHFLLASAVEINDFFEKHREAEFIELYCMLTERWIICGEYKRRYSYYWPLPYIVKIHRIISVVNKLCCVSRKMPFDHHPYSGSQWMAITSKAAKIILHALDLPEVSRFYSKTYIPDEMLFHTLLGNSEVRPHIMKANLNYIVWDRNGSPKILTAEDLDELCAAKRSGSFFTRKLDPEISKELFDKLNSRLESNFQANT